MHRRYIPLKASHLAAMDIELEELVTVFWYSNSREASTPSIPVSVGTQYLLKILTSEVEQGLIDQSIYVTTINFFWRFWGVLLHGCRTSGVSFQQINKAKSESKLSIMVDL